MTKPDEIENSETKSPTDITISPTKVKEYTQYIRRYERFNEIVSYDNTAQTITIKVRTHRHPIGAVMILIDSDNKSVKFGYSLCSTRKNDYNDKADVFSKALSRKKAMSRAIGGKLALPLDKFTFDNVNDTIRPALPHSTHQTLMIMVDRILSFMEKAAK